MSERPHPRAEYRDKVRGWSDGEALWKVYETSNDHQLQSWLLELIMRRRGWMLRNQKGASDE